MKEALVLESPDVKRLIAEKFGVSEDSVIKSQYSYTVIIGEEEEDEVHKSFREET